VSSFVEVLSVERSAETKSNTGSKKDVVRSGRNTTVVHFSLEPSRLDPFSKNPKLTNLEERRGIKSIFACNLQSNVVGSLGVPAGLCSSFDLRIDSVVVRSRNDAKIVGSSDGSTVFWCIVANGGRVSSNGSLLDIKSCLCSDQDTLMAEDCIDICNGPLEQVEKGASMEVGLLEEEVHFCCLFLVVGQELCQNLGLETFGNGIVKLKLGVEGIESSPSLGESQP
jgi:hypothetical protein